jgi:hypothetical protein
LPARPPQKTTSDGFSGPAAIGVTEAGSPFVPVTCWAKSVGSHAAVVAIWPPSVLYVYWNLNWSRVWASTQPPSFTAAEPSPTTPRAKIGFSWPATAL